MSALLSLGLKIGLPVIAAVVGYLWINNAAYNRGHSAGVTETTERMKKAIDSMKKVAVENQQEWQRKSVTEKTTELQKRCVAACQQEPSCEAACKQ